MTHLKRFMLAFVLTAGAAISLTMLSLLWLAMIGGFYLLFDILKAYWPTHFVVGWFWFSVGVAALYTMFKIRQEN